LVGRRREVDLIDSFLGRAGADGGALGFIGDPGVGKTVLLEAATEAATQAGTRILGAGGAEFEADLAFSALNQLLSPIHGEIERLRAVHRDALFRALGFSDGPPPDRLVVSTATMALLRQAAQAQRLLLVVDDVQWLDRSSAAVLGFVARRLAGSRVGLIAASRTPTEGFFAGDGFMVFFNDPLPCPDPAICAVRLGVALRDAMVEVTGRWSRLGHDLGFGVGIAYGYATLGEVGFEGRSEYAVIGSVTNLAARLCDEAGNGEILIAPRVQTAVEHLVDSERLPDITLKGFRKPIGPHNVRALQAPSRVPSS